MNLEQAVEYAAEKLPDGWSIRIEVENGASWVEANRPDGRTIQIDVGDSDLVEQVIAAVNVARIETTDLPNTDEP